MQALTPGKKNKKNKNVHFQTTALLWRYSLPFLPFAHFLSLLPLCVPSLSPPPPHSPCWIGGVNTGRERALFHHTRAGAGRSCSSCAGVKSLLWFSFHLSSANHRATLMRMNSDPGKEFHSKDGLTPGSQLHHLPPPVFTPYYSFSSFNWTVLCTDRT